MRILAIEHELKQMPASVAQVILQEEAAAVWELQKQEVIREIWFMAAEKRAVILLECASKTAAEQHLLSLPLVRGHWIRFEVHQLRAYDGFDRLLRARHPPGTQAER